VTYSYDGLLLTAESSTGFLTGAVSWGYDASFRVTSERVNGASLISFGYDTDSLLTSVGALAYTRRASDGLLLTATLGGTATTLTYSNFGELSTEETFHSGTLLYRGIYARDAGGRLSERTETIGGLATNEVYSYDLSGRLTGVTRGGVPLASYTYDANSNRTSVTTDAGTVLATYDSQDRVVTFGDRTYTHSPNGEVQSWTDSSGTTTLTHDVQGNLLSVNQSTGTTVEYIPDARNRRIGRRVNGVMTHRWLYQGQQRPLAELDASGAVISRFVYGARTVAPEYMVRGGVTYRFITDYLGSVRLVLDQTTGIVVQRLDYDVWGDVTTDTNPGFQPFGYAGGFFDPVTGLLRFGGRDYDPVLARWLAKDPIRFSGGDSNLYSYVGADPINFIDPSGKIPLAAVLALIWSAYEAYDAVTDAAETVNTVLDPCESAWFKGLVGGAFLIGAMTPDGGKLDDLARAIARGADSTKDANRIFKHLEKNHGIEPNLASERLHEIKRAAGLRGDENVTFGMSGDVYDPSGNLIGSLTQAGAKRR